MKPPRAWGAFLFTPAVSLYVAGITLSFMFGRWSAESEGMRLRFLGYSMLAALGLIYFGGNWLQRRGALRWRVKAGAFEATVSSDREPPDADT